MFLLQAVLLVYLCQSFTFTVHTEQQGSVNCTLSSRWFLAGQVVAVIQLQVTFMLKNLDASLLSVWKRSTFRGLQLRQMIRGMWSNIISILLPQMSAIRSVPRMFLAPLEHLRCFYLPTPSSGNFHVSVVHFPVLTVILGLSTP